MTTAGARFRRKIRIEVEVDRTRDMPDLVVLTSRRSAEASAHVEHDRRPVAGERGGEGSGADQWTHGTNLHPSGDD
ncbi:hypothetical protein GCM10022243_16820 [Saccharothrix violaceirubra]|uniref:Uncharacterized protein n=1 Tax=Saccharothrix violaceirubra TaxID=413306 RepID=A0A7W7T6T8_9PSEU|nr:hypothetical protein [Saccharothrix violaceirubra]